MKNSKFQTIIMQSIKKNFEIEDRFFKTIKFKDENLEQLFDKDEKKKFIFETFITDMIIIMGYIAILSYIIIASFKKVALILTISNFFITIILIIISKKTKNKFWLDFLRHIKIFLINISMNLKGILITYIYNNDENDNHGEILRVIIYNYISTNLFILVKLECKLFIYVFYFIINSVSALIVRNFSRGEYFYHLDITYGFVLFLIFYILRRKWDFKVRKIFSEKIKFQNFYQYSIDFINGLNGYHVNLKNESIIYFDTRFADILKNVKIKNICKNENFQNKTFFSFPKNEGPNLNNKFERKLKNAKINDFIKNNTNENIKEKIKNEILKSDNNLGITNNNSNKELLKDGSINYDLFKSLENHDNRLNYDLLKSLGNHDYSRENENKQSLEEKENEDKFNVFLDSLYYLEGKKFDKINKKSFNNYDKGLINNQNQNIYMNVQQAINSNSDSLNINAKYIKLLSTNHKYFESEKKKFQSDSSIEDRGSKKIKTSRFLQNGSNFIEEEKNENINTNRNIIKKKEDETILNKKINKISLLEELKKIQLSKSILQEKFTKLGVYYYNEKNLEESNNTNLNSNKIINRGKNHENEKYFDVFIRRIKLNEIDDLICDLIFYDITELVTTRFRIYEESKKEQKILKKIAHEFKTPLNSIIGIVNNIFHLLDNFNENSNASIQPNKVIHNIKNPKLIENYDKLSNYGGNFSNGSLENLEFLKIKEHEYDFSFIKRDLNIISNLSNYLIILTSDIIQYRKTLNDITISKNIINVKELLHFCQEILKILLNCNKSKSQKIRIILSLDEEIDQMQIYSDETRLKQILLNFISNSVKFTDTGFITINCSIADYCSQKLKISVIDSGLGIKDENKKNIFTDSNFCNLGIDESYVENLCNDWSSPKSSDIGLGLYLSKSLANKLECEIGFVSEFGKGSTFFLSIPYFIKKMD